MLRWNTKAMRALKAAPRVDEVEAEGMDEGRFFVHLQPGWKWADMARHTTAQNVEHSRSFGGAVEALQAVKAAISCSCSSCGGR